MANKLTKKYLDIPSQLAHNKGMANASDTQPVTTPVPEMPATIAPFVDAEEWAEMDGETREQIAGYVGFMESAADAGDRKAEDWINHPALVGEYLYRVLDA